MSEEIEALTTGPIHWFEHWPTGDLTRRVGALPLKSAAVLPSGCGGIR